MRHVPLFRWVLTVGFVLFACSVGLYAVGSEGSASRQIDLTVLDEKPDGACRVRWIDPYAKRAREASYHCDPGRSALLKAPHYEDSRGYGWETGFMFTEGPDRGKLDDFAADPAARASDVLLALGAPLIALGLIGGNLRALPRVLGTEAGVVRRAARLSEAAEMAASDYERAVAAVRDAARDGVLSQDCAGGSGAGLVTALWLAREAGPEARETAALGRQVAEQLRGLLDDAAPAAGVRNMLQAGPRARRQAVQAVAELRRLLGDAERDGLPERFAQASVDLLRGQDGDRAALAADTDFARDPDAYRYLLAQLTRPAATVPVWTGSPLQGHRWHRRRRRSRHPFGILRGGR
ncbi:hypothetical protein OG264_38335 [Streptomyces xanthophaeus]|uniref:hypothetical protein n=1 Tax=Streptomyces xanthophaeus TaxID=67385 RepID=UPI0038684350|nr:hypothetical protein OG264_38335 [Streptomyces xanthophaeus]WST58176.1 hypothetical protein OG605_00100 [Streptomyces xanthophaeus]